MSSQHGAWLIASAQRQQKEANVRRVESSPDHSGALPAMQTMRLGLFQHRRDSFPHLSERTDIFLNQNIIFKYCYTHN